MMMTPGTSTAAAKAVELVEPGSVVGLNGGTTTTAVARHLARDPRFKIDRGHGLTVVTNALNIAADLVLRPHIRTVCLGSEARPESYDLHGPFARHVLEELLIERLFLGIDAISADTELVGMLEKAGVRIVLA